MNDLDLLAAARREVPAPFLRKLPPPPPYHALCTAILQALPAEEYELRERVSEFFSRLLSANLGHRVDEMMFRNARDREDIKAHITTGQGRQLLHSLEPYVTQVWSQVREDGYLLHELQSSIVFVKPRDDKHA